MIFLSAAGSGARSAQSKFQGQQETLYTLAADTGGKALLDNNDLALGIVQAQKDIASYYILGYYSTNDKPDGHYRRIKLTPSPALSARIGELRVSATAPAINKRPRLTAADHRKLASLLGSLLEGVGI